MALNKQEKAAIRYFFEYSQVTLGAALSLGLPDKTQLNFILELNMQNVLPESEPFIRRCLQDLACIEDQMSTFRRSLPLRGVVGSVQYRTGDALDDLRMEYRSWLYQLASILGAPVSPFGQRMGLFGHDGGIVHESYP